MKIGSRAIGDGAPCLVVAEVGLAHDGSLGMAHAYIDAVAKAGAEAVKFQHHRGDEPGEWRIKPMFCDYTRQEYWTKTGFDFVQWDGLREHAEQEGLLFLCSTFSGGGAADMDPLLPAWKVPSGQVTNGPMLDYMAAHPKPTIVSAGMATTDELDAAAKRFPLAVILHATSLYPTPLDHVDLFQVGRLQAARWVRGDHATEFGLSDHSGTIWPAIAAAAGGVAMVEVHVTFSRDAYGPDTSSSITLDELRLLCEGIRAIRECQKPVDRDALLNGPLAEARRAYMVEA